MNRAEVWEWVQTLLPRQSFFEQRYELFLSSLPARPMSTDELARHAYYAGAMAAFHGIAENELRTASWPDEERLIALQALTLEPIEYLKAHGLDFE